MKSSSSYLGAIAGLAAIYGSMYAPTSRYNKGEAYIPKGNWPSNDNTPMREFIINGKSIMATDLKMAKKKYKLLNK